MNLLLNEAERNWRDEVRRDFPLRSDTSVVKQSSQNGRDWLFSTDLKKIYADISNDASLQKKFQEVITKYWDGNPEELAKETLHYLLHHELYHPIEAPFSITGEGNDNKKIHQSIRRGALKAEPALSALEQVTKVQASQNGVKDFILDNRFALDNQEKGYVREDIIPTWDLLELQDSPSKTNFYTVTRFLYGAMYGPESTHRFFEDKSGEKGVEIAEKSLSALTKKPVKLPRQKGLVGKAKSLLGRNPKQDTSERMQQYIKDVREVFSGDDRYAGIERFMSILGPYVEKSMPQGRPDMQGAESGTSPQNILQDLLDDMDPQEQQQFVQDLAQEKPNALEQAVSGTPMPQESSADEMKNLDLLATHEFYKRNHPKIKIVGGSKVGESVVVGKQEYWNLKRTTVLTEDQLSKVNLNRINKLQKRTRLPWLINLGNSTFRLNEYELKEHNLKDVVYVDSHIDVPDMVEFYLDSSGSMFGNEFKVNDGSRWDMLSNVLYGFVDALGQGGKQLGKKTKMRVHNFGDKQVSSEIVPVDKFWKGDTASLKTLFKPANGYSKEDINLTHYRDGRQRTYVVVTDGELVIPGRTARESRKMKEIAQDHNNNVVLFEIGGTYDLGKAVKSDSSIVYHQVHDKNKMLSAGLEVLLSK
ncbi:MAG: hypothetical protein KKB88_02375 [Nanoarchaeota archaeon]|nr:hypothetical protein [Nanoarchaeota archaeon]